MKDKKRNAIRLGAAALAALCLMAGIALAAGEGSQTDPLVTLSYLTQTVIPSILDQVDGKVDAYQQTLVDKLTGVVQDYSSQMDEAVKDLDSKKTASYAVVTLKKGQQLKMEVGCEVMLRIGTAQCVSSSTPGLIDVTTGGALNNGEALVTNHLYMATITGRSVSATANTVKVLVRGSYTIA